MKTLIDPCHLTPSLGHKTIMDHAHGYLTHPRGYRTGDQGTIANLPFTYIHTGGDGLFHQVPVDSGSLLLIDGELPPSLLPTDPSLHRTLTDEEARPILTHHLDLNAKREKRNRETLRHRMARAIALVKRWGIRGAREIQQNRGRYFLANLTFRQWQGRKSGPVQTGTFLIESPHDRLVHIHLPGGTIIKKDPYSKHFSETRSDRHYLTRRSFLLRKAKLAA